jgi:DNA-directed RNA polymerase specialized sigma24 family protein
MRAFDRALPSSESVTELLQRLKAGDEAVAQQLWQRYLERLVRLAGLKLGRARKRVEDEEDVVLSAFHAFLAGAAKSQFPRLDDRHDLWQVLVMLTERKAITLRRREQAAKRGSGRVRGDSVFVEREAISSCAPGLAQFADQQPTPQFALAMRDELARLLASLGDHLERQVAIGKFEGRTNAELAETLGLSLRSVERKLSLIRRRWEEEGEP